MKTKNRKKLHLRAETVHHLTTREVVEIAGGLSTNCTRNCTQTDTCTDSCAPLSVCICR
jgi:hypothetical protein